MKGNFFWLCITIMSVKRKQFFCQDTFIARYRKPAGYEGFKAGKVTV